MRMHMHMQAIAFWLVYKGVPDMKACANDMCIPV